MSELSTFDPNAEAVYQQWLAEPLFHNDFLDLLEHNPDQPTVIPLASLTEVTLTQQTAELVVDRHLGLLALGLYCRTVPALDPERSLRPAKPSYRPAERYNPYYVLTKGMHGRVSDVSFTTLPVDEETATRLSLPRPDEIQPSNMLRIGLSGKVRYGSQLIPSTVETIVAIREGEDSLSIVIKSKRDPKVDETLKRAKQKPRREADTPPF